MTTATDPAGLSPFLLGLYHLAHERPIEAFQDAALDRLRGAVPFDSCMWGTATYTSQGIDIHTIHLLNQPAEMLGAYEEIKQLDTAAQAVALPGRHTVTGNLREWYRDREQAPFIEHGKRFEQANFLVTSEVDAATRYAHWISLYRANEAARCNAQEARLLALLAPHLMQALSLNRMAHLHRLALAAPDGSERGFALCDPRGVVAHADAAFASLMRTEWTDWGGRRLPDTLLSAFLRGQSDHRGRFTVVSQRREHGLLFLGARPRAPVDRLTPRERLVAQLAARGSTHKEIALALGRSPATVRNQLRAVYDKLQITHVASLADALRVAAMP
jgi:DNA-binding CsgD family transcriptional regulator